MKRDDIARISYNDGVFYEPDIDFKYYFIDRLGLGQDCKDIVVEVGNLNSTRGLKADTEGTKEEVVG
jgi:hypothetical protein